MHLPTSKKIIGEMIKHQRIKCGLTQNELAAKLKADRQYVSKIENGKINMTFNYLDRVLKKLDVKPKIFFLEFTNNSKHK